jgi:hypothetical protein
MRSRQHGSWLVNGMQPVSALDGRRSATFAGYTRFSWTATASLAGGPIPNNQDCSAAPPLETAKASENEQIAHGSFHSPISTLAETPLPAT